MQSLKIAVVIASLLAVAAALRCLQTKLDPASACEGPICYFQKEWDLIAHYDIESGCKTEDTWCEDKKVSNDCKEISYGNQYCCCSSYEGCRTDWFREDYMLPPATPTAAASTTRSVPKPSASSSSASKAVATTGTSASAPARQCSENMVKHQKFTCPSGVCYRLFGNGEVIDYGCADRFLDLPADVVVAVCRGKGSRYCFDSNTEVDNADVIVCCCDSRNFCNGE